jgi:hypothetical protein
MDNYQIEFTSREDQKEEALAWANSRSYQAFKNIQMIDQDHDCHLSADDGCSVCDRLYQEKNLPKVDTCTEYNEIIPQDNNKDSTIL